MHLQLQSRSTPIIYVQLLSSNSCSLSDCISHLTSLQLQAPSSLLVPICDERMVLVTCTPPAVDGMLLWLSICDTSVPPKKQRQYQSIEEAQAQCLGQELWEDCLLS